MKLATSQLGVKTYRLFFRSDMFTEISECGEGTSAARQASFFAEWLRSGLRDKKCRFESIVSGPEGVSVVVDSRSGLLQIQCELVDCLSSTSNLEPTWAIGVMAKPNLAGWLLWRDALEVAASILVDHLHILLAAETRIVRVDLRDAVEP